MSKKETISVQGTEITVFSSPTESDYISLTDMANAKEGKARAADIIKNWIRTRTTLEFLGTWEQMYNPNFKVVEFDHFKMQAGLPSFVLSPGQWIECSSIRQNRYSMAKRKSQSRWKYKRLCNLGATCCFVKHGKHKCSFNSPKYATARKNKAIKQRCYFANEIFIRQSKYKTAKKR